MGRLIDADAVKKKYPLMENKFGMIIFEGLHKAIDSMPTIEAIPKAELRKILRDNADKVSDSMLDIVKELYIPKADYENRLKADMVAMLRFLWNDIEDLDAPICENASSDCISKWQVHELIQEKINALKEAEE